MFAKICDSYDFAGNTQYLDPKTSFQGSTANVAAYGIAFYQGLWAYDGW